MANEYKRADLRPRTWESYEIIVRNHLVPAIGALPLQSLRPEHLQKLYNEKTAQGYSPQTVHHINKVIHGALEQAIKNRLIQHNPAKAVTLPRLKRDEIQVMTREQQTRFIEALADHPLGVAFLVLLGTGIRRGELLGLHWADVDLEEGVIYIRNNLVQVKGRGLVLQEPKTEKSKRIIPLPRAVLEELKRHQERMREAGLYDPEDPNTPVFCSGEGNYIWPRNFSRAYDALRRKAGIEGITLHALRHTFATNLLEHGENLKVVQELLGHAKIATTADIYSHVAPEIKREAVKKLDQLFHPGTNRAPISENDKI